MKMEQSIWSLVANWTFFLFPKMIRTVLAKRVSASQRHSTASYRFNANNTVLVAFNRNSNHFLLVSCFIPFV